MRFFSLEASFSIGVSKMLPNRHFGSTKKSQVKQSPVYSTTMYWLHCLSNVQIVCLPCTQYDSIESKSRMLSFCGPYSYQRSNILHINSPYCCGVIEKSATSPVAGSSSTQGINCRNLIPFSRKKSNSSSGCSAFLSCSRVRVLNSTLYFLQFSMALTTLSKVPAPEWSRR